MSDNFNLINQLQLTQLSIIVFVKFNNPSILTPDFLRINNIVDKNWKVENSSTFMTDKLSQVVYENGVKIGAQLDGISFHQSIEGDYTPEKITISTIFNKYLSFVPCLEYSRLIISPVAHIVFESQEKAIEYMNNIFIRPGDWKNFKGTSPLSSIILSYSLEDYQINISIDYVLVIDKKESEKETPAILFSGSIDRTFISEDQSEKSTIEGISPDQLNLVKQKISSFSEDVDNYISLIQNCLLSQK